MQALPPELSKSAGRDRATRTRQVQDKSYISRVVSKVCLLALYIRYTTDEFYHAFLDPIAFDRFVRADRASSNRLVGAAFSPHRHDTYTVALTMAGVQTFNYRGAIRHSLPGQVLILHPDEVHDGHCRDEAGFSYWAAYIPPTHVQTVLGGAELPVCVQWRLDKSRLDRGSL